MVSPLWKFRPWLTVAETAEQISELTDTRTGEADVLRLALDGYLKLSVNLPMGAEVSCFGNGVQDRPTIPKRIGGVWELPMLDAGRIEIETWFHSLRGLSPIHLKSTEGALVQQGGEVCRLRPEEGRVGMSSRACSALPDGTVVVVRSEAIAEFVAEMSRVAPQSQPEASAKPLQERERATLLTIIAALADAAGIEVAKPSKAGETIEALTTAMGARVSARAIEDHLKRIPDALERRGKNST